MIASPSCRPRHDRLQHPEDRRGDDGQPAVVDDQVETFGQRLQLVLFTLRAGVEADHLGTGAPGAISVTGRMMPAAMTAWPLLGGSMTRV